MPLVVGEYRDGGGRPRRVLGNVSCRYFPQRVHQTWRHWNIRRGIAELQQLNLEFWVLRCSHLLRQHCPTRLSEDCKAFGAGAQRIQRLLFGQAGDVCCCRQFG